jgi:tetratricopeptide (TPR) repeat protein
MQLQEPSELARSVLALAYLRSGDEAGARAVVDSLMLSATPPSAAIALSLRLDAIESTARESGPEATPPDLGSDTSATAGADTTAADTAGDDSIGSVEPPDPDHPEPDKPEPDKPEPDKPKPDKPEPDKPKPDTDNGGKGMSVSRMIDVGCERAERGKAKEALDLLERALDQRFRDPDISICIGIAHMKLGNARAALVAYERALDISPRLGAAVRGAARAAKKSGQTQKAINYYKRVLEIEPRNAEARAYVDQHSGGGSETKEETPAEGDAAEGNP